MPRNLDLYRRNAQVTNNPLNRLSVQNLAAIINQPLPNLGQISENTVQAEVDNFLNLIDQATGLNLLAWVQQVQAALQQSWLSFQGLINGVLGELDKDWGDLVTALNATADNASSATGDWTTVFEDLGLPEATAAGFATYITGWTTDINDILGSFSTGGTSTEFVTGVENLLNLLGLSSSTLGSATDLTTVWTDIINDIINPLNLLLTTASTDWNDLIQSIFGSASSPGLVGSFPSTAVTGTTQSLQPLSTFPDAASISAGGGWSYAPGVSYGDSGGSALFTASGALGVLMGIPGAVQAGQVVTPAAWVQWSGLSATGSPIQLQLVPGTVDSAGAFIPGTAVTPTGCAITAPASSASWTQLTGTYTVPSSGVSAVQLQLVVTQAAAAGSIWWSDCTSNVTGGYLAALESDLTSLQDDSEASTAAFSTFLSSVYTAIEDYTSWSTFIAAVESAWNTYTTTESNLLSDEIFTVQQFFATLLGVNTSTGLISQANIEGLTTLQDDFTANGDAFSTLLQSWLTAIEGYTSWSTFIAAFESAWSTYTTTVSGLESSEIATVQQILSSLLGINTSTGQIQSTTIESSTGGTSLNSDISAILTPFESISDLTSTSAWQSAWSGLMNLLGIDTTSVATGAATQVPASAVGHITIGGVTDSIETHIQSIVDNAVQALTGGSSTGNPTTAMKSNLLAIPAGNIVGSMTSTSITHGATGAAADSVGSSLTTSASVDWSHTIGAGDNYVVVGMWYLFDTAVNDLVRSVNYGGSPMSSLGYINAFNFEYYGGLELFGLVNPPSGAQTVTADVFGADAIYSIGGNSISYSGWASTTPATTADAGGNYSPSLTIASATDDIAVCMFWQGTTSGSESLTSFSGTSRYSVNDVSPVPFWPSGSMAAVLGDAAGASTVTFTAAGVNTGIPSWFGIGVNLSPAI